MLCNTYHLEASRTWKHTNKKTRQFRHKQNWSSLEHLGNSMHNGTTEHLRNAMFVGTMSLNSCHELNKHHYNRPLRSVKRCSISCYQSEQVLPGSWQKCFPVHPIQSTQGSFESFSTRIVSNSLYQTACQ